MQQERWQGQVLVVRVLSIAGCPHVEQTVERVWAALRAEGLTGVDAVRATVERVEVTGEAMARRLGFLGSPSVHVNGRDAEPEGELEARGVESTGMGCRTYVHAGERTGVPSVALLRRALTEGLAKRGTEDARRAAHGDAAEAAVDSGAEG